MLDADGPLVANEFAAITSRPPFLLSDVARVRYVLLATFHSEIYFSIHWDRQVCSPVLIVEPGDGMQLSKQCSFTFCVKLVRVFTIFHTVKTVAGGVVTYADELAGVAHGSFLLELLQDGSFDFQCFLAGGAGGGGGGGGGTEKTHSGCAVYLLGERKMRMEERYS